MATTQDNDIVVARLDDLVGGDLRRRTQPVARTRSNRVRAHPRSGR